jgi:8-oxo-dGTP pyrophosphatase MutT (NUDIX family)
MSHISDLGKPRAIRPRDAATLIVIDRSGLEPRVLMGRRRPDQVFLPNTYVFPGGRLERTDRTTPVARALATRDEAHLMIGMQGRPSPERARALAIAALRETFEETGLLVSAKLPACQSSLMISWQDLIVGGARPDLSQLIFFARAITPPGRPRRYDTRFFCAPADCVGYRASRTDGELLDVQWLRLAEVQRLDLPNITRRIVDDLESYLSDPRSDEPNRSVPFYFQRSGVYQRALLSQDAASP